MTVFEKQQVRVLAWKEIQEQGPVMVLWVVMTLVGPGMFLLFEEMKVEGGSQIALMLNLFTLPLFAILLGGLSYGSELVEETEDYLATRPLEQHHIFITKALFGALACVAVAILVTLLPRGDDVGFAETLAWIADPRAFEVRPLWLFAMFLAAQAGQLAVRSTLPSMATSVLFGVLIAVALSRAGFFLQLLAVVALLGVTYRLASWRFHSSGGF